MLLNFGKDQKANKNIHNKELCSAGILKIIKRFFFFFSEMRQGAKRKTHSPEILYGYYFLAHYISNILTVS